MGVMERRRAIIAAQDGFIPPEYQKYDYLSCVPSRSYIDTGVAGNNENLILDLVFEYTYTYSYAYPLYGNYVDENTKCWRLIQNSTDDGLLIFTTPVRRAGASNGVRIGDETSVKGKKVNLRTGYGWAETNYNGITRRTNQSASDNPISTNNIAVGSNKTTGNGTGTQRSVWFYSFKIFDGSKLIRNYVPVTRKTDSKVGFYDTVNHTFNPSIGNMEFIAGND